MQDFYYHGSQQGGITTLEPRCWRRRNNQDGPRVYAAPDIGIAAAMLVKGDDSIARFGRWGVGPWLLEIVDPERFKDTSGWIYTVDSEGVRAIGNGVMEVYFEQEKNVIDSLYVPSALELVKANDILVYERTSKY